MRNICSFTQTPSACPGISLQTVWDVDVGAGYDISPGHDAGAAKVIVRTLAGKGCLDLATGLTVGVTEKTLLLVEKRLLKRYRTDGRRWRFWWFVFTSNSPLSIPSNRPLNIVPSPADAPDFRTLFLALRRESPVQRRWASAIFTMMLERWLASWKDDKRPIPHQAELERVMEQMHIKLSRQWTVAEMAVQAHLSERRFRQVFFNLTGQSPKAYYDGLRLAMAREILQQQQENVSQVANRFGYSSPFHFSRAFRAHFGIPPSKVP